jgi:transcriptional regulator with XRE-family HTH domain
VQQNILFSRSFSAGHPPRDAPEKVLRQIEFAWQALATSIEAGRHKQAYIARCIGKSEGYVSRLCSGKREIPEKLIDRLCQATGCNLLRQFVDRQQRLADVNDEMATVRRAAAQLVEWREERRAAA